MVKLSSFLNVYEFNTVLKGSGETINYKGLSTNSLKKLLMYTKEEDPLMEEELLDKVLEVAIIDENCNIDKMFVLDRYYLLIKIRASTKGDIFEYLYTCPECKQEQPKSINLADLEINKQEKCNPLIELKSLHFILGHPTREKQKRFFNLIDKKLSKQEKQVEILLADLAAYVEEVRTPDGKLLEVDDNELSDFIGALPEDEVDKFNKWIEDYYFGIIDKIDIKCNKCKYEEKKQLPLKSFFS